jgi:hypothetical protein
MKMWLNGEESFSSSREWESDCLGSVADDGSVD